MSMKKKHNYRGTRTYTTWVCMRARCNRPTASDYPRYGGRGIKVCDEWNEFLNFLADMGERPENKTLDRIDTNGNYCKSNCRWATNKEQLRNTRVNRRITYQGEIKCLAEWAEIYKLKQATLAGRLDKGWPVAKALKTPLYETRIGAVHNRKLIEYNGETRNIKEWAKHYGINYATLHKRLTTYGMSFEEAVNRPIGKYGNRKNHKEATCS